LIKESNHANNHFKKIKDKEVKDKEVKDKNQSI